MVTQWEMGHLIIGQGIVHTAVLIYAIIIATATHTHQPAGRDLESLWKMYSNLAQSGLCTLQIHLLLWIKNKFLHPKNMSTFV